MAEHTQVGRLLAINTPLGKDVLLLTGISGREEMSRLFSFQLDLLSEKSDIAPKDVVGKNVTFTVYPGQDAARHFNGFVSRFSAGGLQIRDLRFYRAEVVPWLWFLTQTADCRIFQNKTVPDIIEQIFKDLGFSDYKIFVNMDAHPTRDYCVQYRESDFQFISRLMEEEGIFYFFRHEDGKHTLVLDDQKNAYKDCPEKEVQHYIGSLEESHVTQWDHHYEFRHGKFAQTDYNFETPSTSLMTSTSTLVKLPNVDKFEIYDYPGEYMKKADGETLAKIRMEEAEAAHDVVQGASNCRSFCPGGKFTLKKHPCPSEAGKSYVITAIQHSASDSSYTQGSEAADQDYKNSFTCIPDSVLFRPARITPKPTVQGVQTAVVVGPPGEEIHTDKFSRVKVQFHWDREGKRDDSSSCWIRVSQAYSGQGWGSMCIPRIGQEVIVDFLEGDPDQPIITGRVYNAEQMPPFALPGNKVVTGMKSNSSPGGGGYNEISMNDTKGKETMTVHAQKDLNTTIENNETHIVVGGTQGVTVKGDASLTVQSGNRPISVDSGTYSVEAAKAVILHGKSEGVGIEGNAEGVGIKGTGKGVGIEGTGEGVGIKGDPVVGVEGTSEIILTSPFVGIGDGDVVVDAKKIVLQAPGGSITIDGSGITISGAKIVSAAQGTHDITGALVKIN